MANQLELAIVESHAARRAQYGLRGLGAGEGLGSMLAAWAAAGAGAAVLVGVVAGAATKSARTGTMVGGGLLLAEAVVAGGVYGYYQYQMHGMQTQHAPPAPAATGSAPIGPSLTPSPIVPPTVDAATARALAPLSVAATLSTPPSVLRQP